MVILPFKVTGMLTGMVEDFSAYLLLHHGLIREPLCLGGQPLAAAPAALVALAPPVCPAAPEQPLHGESKGLGQCLIPSCVAGASCP